MVQNGAKAVGGIRYLPVGSKPTARMGVLGEDGEPDIKPLGQKKAALQKDAERKAKLEAEKKAETEAKQKSEESKKIKKGKKKQVSINLPSKAQETKAKQDIESMIGGKEMSYSEIQSKFPFVVSGLLLELELAGKVTQMPGQKFKMVK